MLQSISWQQYLIVVISLAGIYYIIITVLYYRKEVQLFFIRGFQRNKRLPGVSLAEMIPEEVETSVMSKAVQGLMEEVNVLLRKAAHQQYPKEELIMALQMKLRDYSTIKGTRFQHAINEHIRSQSEVRCNVQFCEVELMQLW